MIIENFDDVEVNTLVYGGRSGQKLGIIINNENWFLKFPKSTKVLKILTNVLIIVFKTALSCTKFLISFLKIVFYTAAGI